MKPNPCNLRNRSLCNNRGTTCLVLLSVLLLQLHFTGSGFGQPVISTQPRSLTNVVGTTATFSVAASGVEPLAYQWQKLTAVWADLEVGTNSTLVLVDIQSSHGGDYRVVITNSLGCCTSDVAHLTVLVPPRIIPVASFQHQAVHVGSNALFKVAVSGTPPLAYQWRLNGHDLANATNVAIQFYPAQPEDEGDYTVVVTNAIGAVTSESARLWVVPPPSVFIKANYTNGSFRFPYYYLMPTNYNAARCYPLAFMFHGGYVDEISFTNGAGGPPGWLGFGNYPATKVLASYRQQATDPAIVVWPTLRVGDSAWPPTYIWQATNLLDHLITQFNIDTNRIYVGGGSAGFPAAWNFLGLRRSYFAGGLLLAGTQGATAPSAIKEVPLWFITALDDVSEAAAVRWLRIVGGKPIYTEYQTGGHLGGIWMGLSTPAVVDWLLGQRRGLPTTNEPLLVITHPSSHAVFFTAKTSLSLGGWAAALGRDVMQVSWTNYANNAKGLAAGSNVWSVPDVPLVGNRTNLIVVVGSTTSWAPAYGGSTTFNDTLSVVQCTNTAPCFTGGPDQFVLEDAGAQTVTHWATNISAGTQLESAQTLIFIINSDNAELFSIPPAVSPTGTLTYTPATNAYGVAVVTVVLHDDGGTDSGGQDTSAPQTFLITVLPVNDPPIARLTVAPLAEFPGVTNLLVIAPDGEFAQVVLDGSPSSDLENDALDYSWIESGSPIAAGMIASHRFVIGTHTITLAVSDGQESSAASVTVDIVTPAESVRVLSWLVEESGLSRQRQRALAATLQAAAAAFERGSYVAGVNQLQAFQNKVRAQVGSRNRDVADALVNSAQIIIQALSGERVYRVEGNARRP